MTPCPKPTKKRKPERRTLEANLDKLTSLIVRWRDGRCVVCGATGRLQCGHLIKRGKHVIRFSLLNCNCQCASCNFKHNNYPEPYTAWFLRQYGEAEYCKLEEAARVGEKLSISELRDLLMKYRDLWDNRPSLIVDRAQLEALGYYGPLEEREMAP